MVEYAKKPIGYLNYYMRKNTPMVQYRFARQADLKIFYEVLRKHTFFKQRFVQLLPLLIKQQQLLEQYNFNYNTEIFNNIELIMQKTKVQPKPLLIVEC